MVIDRVGPKGVFIVSCVGALCLVGSRILSAEHANNLTLDIVALVLATAALAAIFYARSWSRREKAEMVAATAPGASAAGTFRADQAQPLAEPPAAKVTLPERLVFFMLLAVLGGMGPILAWTPGAAVVAAIAFAVLMVRDMVVRRGMSLALAPFYGVTLFGGYSLFILGGWLAGAVMFAH